MHSKCSIVLIVCLVTSALFAQVGGRSTGMVKDPSSAAIADATVVAVNSASEIKLETKTDDQGGCTFPALSPGTASRRLFYGPGMNNSDMALLKETHFNETKVLEFRLAGGAQVPVLTGTGRFRLHAQSVVWHHAGRWSGAQFSSASRVWRRWAI